MRQEKQNKNWYEHQRAKKYEQAGVMGLDICFCISAGVDLEAIFGPFFFFNPLDIYTIFIAERHLVDLMLCAGLFIYNYGHWGMYALLSFPITIFCLSIFVV